MTAAALRIRKVKAAGLELGLVWAEVYLPFDVEAFAEFAALERKLGSTAAAAKADPGLFDRAITPIDSQGEAMLPEDLELLAHRFLSVSRKFDADHDEAARKSVVLVESFINGPEVQSPHFFPGSWVAVFQVAKGSPEWERIEAGELRAVSFQAFVERVAITVREAA